MYRTCDKLPLDIFEDCLIDGDLSGLGSGPEVQDVWDKIYVQSLELSQDGSYNEIFEVMKEINDIRAKITIADSAIKFLQLRFDSEIVSVLNSLALQCEVAEGDSQGAVVSKLNAVVARMKKWFPKLNRLEADLVQLRTVNVGKIDRSYFDKCLDAISENFFFVRSSDITVSRFYGLLVKLNKQAESETVKKLKHGS